jgi:catalase (peroxidase I)
VLSNDPSVHLLAMATTCTPTSESDDLFEGRDRRRGGDKSLPEFVAA